MLTQILGGHRWRRYEPLLPAPDPESKPEKLTKPRQFNTPTLRSRFEDGLLDIERRYNGFLWDTLHPDPTENAVHAKAIKEGRSLMPSPSQKHPCWACLGLVVHPAYQGKGVGKALMRYGMDEAEKEGVPIFTGAETTALRFFERLGFKRMVWSEYWLDGEGGKAEKEEEERWKKENGGVSGSMIVWCPKGVTVKIEGVLYEND